MDVISSNLVNGINNNQRPAKGPQGKPEALVAEGESLSKESFMEALNAKGVNEAKVEEIFAEMDTDGNGEISYAEEQAMFEARKSQKGPPSRFSEQNTDADSIQTMLQSVLESNIDDETKSQLNAALENMQTSGFSQQSISESVALLNETFPRLDVKA